MGISATIKSTSKNNLSSTPSPFKERKEYKIIELNMNAQGNAVDEREEGEIIDEFEDIISSDEEFSMRKRIEELEAKNAELEKIANISVSAAYASGAYDFPKKDSHHNDRYPLVSITVSDDEEYPPAPKMSRLPKRRKSMQHSSSRHKTHSSSSQRRRKRSSSPPPAPLYRQSDKLLLSLFHDRVSSYSSQPSKRKRKSKKTHSTKSSRKQREYYVSISDDDYNFDSYHVDGEDSRDHFNSSDGEKSFSLNRDELRVALARNTHRNQQHASLKDRLTRKKVNTDVFNNGFVEDSPAGEIALEAEEQSQQQGQEQKQDGNTILSEQDKAESDDNLEEQELRILALKSAVLRKHMVRKKRNENVAYSPSDFDEIYKCVSDSPVLNNMDDAEAFNSTDVSPVPSPKMVLSDDGGEIDTKPIDMDIVNSDSECELPSNDKWIPIEQIPLPNSYEVDEKLYNPIPMRFDNDNQRRPKSESATASPKNYNSDVDEEELALRTLLLAKMNLPKVNKVVREEAPIVVKVQTPDPDVSLEAEALRNFLIKNMEKKAKSKHSSASVLKEAVRRLTERNNLASPSEIPPENKYHLKTADETEKELAQAITGMANVNIEIKVECKSEIVESKNSPPLLGGIRVRNIEALRAPQSMVGVNLRKPQLNVQKNNIACSKYIMTQEKENSKQTPEETSQVVSTKGCATKDTPIEQSKHVNDILKQSDRKLVVKIEKMVFPKTLHTKEPTETHLKKEEIAVGRTSELVNDIDVGKIKSEVTSEMKQSGSASLESISLSVDSKSGAQGKSSVEEIADSISTDVDPNNIVDEKSTNSKQEPAIAIKESEILDDAIENLHKESSPQKKRQTPILSQKNLILEVSEDLDPKENSEKINLGIKSNQTKDTVAGTDEVECIPNENEKGKTLAASKLEPVKAVESNETTPKNPITRTEPSEVEDPTNTEEITHSFVEEEIPNPDLQSVSDQSTALENFPDTLLNVDHKDVDSISTSAILHVHQTVGKSSISEPMDTKESKETQADATSKLEPQKEAHAGPLINQPTSTLLSKSTVQTKAETTSSQQKKSIDNGKQVPTLTSKFPSKEKLIEHSSIKTVIKNTTTACKTSFPSATNTTSIQKPAIQLQTQQSIATRTKIVKPNKVINQQTVEDLKRKSNDTVPQPSVAVKKPKFDDGNRLITTAEIPKVPELVIQLRASESESEYSEVSGQEMEEDEDSRVGNFFNRSITIGNEYYDIASPISLPMESPCETPNGPASPACSSRTQTPQPIVEKSIVNNFFEAKLEEFLKNVRSKVAESNNTVNPVEVPKVATVINTPVAVRHLPEASQQEYRRLISRMKMLERQKQAKNLQVVVKTTDAVTNDGKNSLTENGSKCLVRKVLVKNATAIPVPNITNPKATSPQKTDTIIVQKTVPPLSTEDTKATKPSKQNQLALYEDSYRKTGVSIISNLDKSIGLVMVAKEAKMAKLKHEQRLSELREQMEEVELNIKVQQEKISKIYPEISNYNRTIESLKTRRLKINKAVTTLGKNVLGPNYCMENDQKAIISEKSKKLAAEIKFVNTMKISDVEAIERQKHLRSSDKAATTNSPEQQLPVKSSSVVPRAVEVKPPTPKSLSIKEQQIASKTCMPNPSLPIENQVPTCYSDSHQIVNPTATDVCKDADENLVNDTNVPEKLSNEEDQNDNTITTSGHEEALETTVQPIIIGDDNKEQAAAHQQSNVDENISEENGEQVGSAKLQDYVSPLSHLRDERQINPNGVVCPYQLMGQCDDKDCKYMHLED